MAYQCKAPIRRRTSISTSVKRFFVLFRENNYVPMLVLVRFALVRMQVHTQSRVRFGFSSSEILIQPLRADAQ